MTDAVARTASKVPEVTLIFWIIKIAATTLGETGGDTVTMTLNWGYLVGTALFLALLVVLVICQIAAKKFHPFLYWATIVASTTAGTTMADFADRSLGIGYAGGSSLLFACVMATLGAWYWSQGSISVATVNTPKVEAFYWVAITFSQTLGTALGDWMADSTGYEHGAFVFAAGLAVLAAAYFFTNVSRVFLFWAAFILTRPLGASVGDFLDKPVSDGGLAFSRPIASAIIAAFIIALHPRPAAAGRTTSRRSRDGGIAAERSDHLPQERALFRNDEALRLRQREVGGAFAVGLQPRPVGLVGRQARERDQPVGDVVGALVRHPIADDFAAAFRNDCQPIARIGFKAVALIRIELIANEDGDGHRGLLPVACAAFCATAMPRCFGEDRSLKFLRKKQFA